MIKSQHMRDHNDIKSKVREAVQNEVKGQKGEKEVFSGLLLDGSSAAICFSLLINHCPPPLSPHAPPLLVHLENVPHADTKVTFHQAQSNTFCNIYTPPHPLISPPLLPPATLLE